MKATDWKERQEAINELEQYIITHPNSLGSNLVKVRKNKSIKLILKVHNFFKRIMHPPIFIIFSDAYWYDPYDIDVVSVNY